MAAEAKQGMRAKLAGAADDGRPRPARSRELQDPLNRYLYHPLAERLARLLLPTPVSANAVSIGGGLLICAAAWSYTTLAWPIGAMFGLALHMSWHVLDGADGDLARMRGGGSPIGELIDGLADHIGHIVLYVALAAFLAQSIGGVAWAYAVAGGFSHALQTNHAESQRRAYLWWVYGVPWLRHARAQGEGPFTGRHWLGRLFAPAAGAYLHVAHAATPHIGGIDAALDAAGGGPARARFRRIARRATRGSLAFQKLLGPNLRAPLLGASMIATGQPLWFFIVEATLMNVMLVASLIHHRATGARLAQVLDRPSY
jgi:hypothetical protein